MGTKKGFTLVEILIVVVILGILAAIVIPQFSDASGEAKLSALKSNLQTVRSQIELYKIQHNFELPSAGTATFVQAMTSKTTKAGAVDANGVCGSYIQTVPVNPFNDLATVEEGTGAPAGGSHGWYFNTSTGKFSPDDDDHKND